MYIQLYSKVCLVSDSVEYDAMLLMLPDYRHGICLTNTKNNKVLIMLSARSERDRKNFIDDLKETILEVPRGCCL